MLTATGNQSWRTPPPIFMGLHMEFAFTIDGAASAENNLLARYWSEQDDALHLDWSGERVFCNPPWKKIRPFLEKGLAHRETALSVFLLPASIDTAWFHDLAVLGWKDLFRGRIAFVAPPGVKQSTPPTGAILVVIGAGWASTGLGFARSRCNRTARVLTGPGAP